MLKSVLCRYSLLGLSAIILNNELSAHKTENNTDAQFYCYVPYAILYTLAVKC